MDASQQKSLVSDQEPAGGAMPQESHIPDEGGAMPEESHIPESDKLGTSSLRDTPETAASVTGAESQKQRRNTSSSIPNVGASPSAQQPLRRSSSPIIAGSATHSASQGKTATSPRMGTQASSPGKTATQASSQGKTATSPRMGTQASSPGKTATQASSPGKTSTSPRMGTQASSPGKTATQASSPGKTATSPRMGTQASSPAKTATMPRTGTQGSLKAATSPRMGTQASSPGKTATSPRAGTQGVTARKTVSIPARASSPMESATSKTRKAQEQVKTSSTSPRSATDAQQSNASVGAKSDASGPKNVGISQGMKDGIRRLQAWVRPGPPPLKKGLFMMQRDDNGLNMAKYVELLDEGLRYSDAPDDSSGFSSPFAPEGVIAMRDVVDMEPVRDGFQLILADRSKIFFYGPQNAAGGTLDDWMAEVGERLDLDLEKRAALEDDRPRGRSDDPGEEVFSCRVFRVVKQCPKRFPAWAVLSTRQFRMDPVEVKGETAEEKLKAPPPCYIDIDDIKEVKMTPNGFTVETTYKERQEVEVPDKSEVQDWADAWDSLLVDGFEKPGPGHWRRREIKRLHSCPMELVRDGEHRDVHGVVYTNRLALYEDEDAAEMAKDAVLEIWPSQVLEVSIQDDGISLVTTIGNILLRILNEDGDLDKTYGALQTCFGRLPLGDEEEARRAASKLRNDINKRDLPSSANPRAIQKTMDDDMPDSDRAICQGMLAFYDVGALRLRYGVLFADRLQAWDSVDDLCNDCAPPVNLNLEHVGSVDRVSSGFILNCKQPANTKAGVYVGDKAELDIWILKLQGALDKLRGDADEDEEATQSYHPPGKFPQRAKPGFVPRCAAFAKRGELPKRMVKKENIKLNTHRAGWQAHGLIRRGLCPNPKDLNGTPITNPIADHTGSSTLVKSRYSLNVGLATKPNTGL